MHLLRSWITDEQLSGRVTVVSGNGDPCLPVLGIGPKLRGAVCIEFPFRSDSWWVMVPTCVPTHPAVLEGTHHLRSRPPASVAPGNCILMQNKFPRIYWDVQKNQLSLQFVHSGWIISWIFLWQNGKQNGCDTELCPQVSLVRARRKGQHWSWALLLCACNCTSSTSKLASDKQVISLSTSWQLTDEVMQPSIGLPLLKLPWKCRNEGEIISNQPVLVFWISLCHGLHS